MSRFDAAATLEGLKDFQRATADYVFARMYDPVDPAHRFLVADEVGLGKTLVTRGVIAKAVEHLQDQVERIDVIYICSNGQIARQNLNRLRIGVEADHELVDRITMLPISAHQLEAQRPRGRGGAPSVNLVSFTPGTSFDLRHGAGMGAERAVIRLMLSLVWPELGWRSNASFRVFQGQIRSLDRFTDLARHYRDQYRSTVPEALVANLQAEMDWEDARRAAKGQPSLRDAYLALVVEFSRERTEPRLRATRARFVGEIRHLLARACLSTLEPDLIILDEFQRFTHLLAPPPEVHPDGTDLQSEGAGHLARELFEYVDETAGLQARVLLLSATPYKMLTTGADRDEDHYEDLIKTAGFLMEHDSERVGKLRQDLRDLHAATLQAGRDAGAEARRARHRVEADLRRVMVRTERLAATPDRSGMLGDVDHCGVGLEMSDVKAYVGAARAARHLQVDDPLEYWKSAPYLANFQGGYAFGQALDERQGADPELARMLDSAGILDFERLAAFEPLEPANPRLRWLLSDVTARGAWKLLWVPPSLPYLQPSGPFADPALAGFTKRLVFSSWTMVPRVISTLVSYEAERQIVSARKGRPAYRNEPEARSTRALPLPIAKSKDRLTGMPVWGILYPSYVLAEIGDSLALARGGGGLLRSVEDAVAAVATALAARVSAIVEDLAKDGRKLPVDGPEDQRWYWAAPMWLDWLADEEAAEGFLARLSALQEAFERGERDNTENRFKDHLRLARDTCYDYPRDLGRMPEDLTHVLARTALGGPGPVALRALARATRRPLTDLVVRRAACSVAWGLRSLFNGPEVAELVRGLFPAQSRWQRVVSYAIAGNLQAVLDEYAAVLIPSGGHQQRGSDATVEALAAEMRETIQLRTVTYGVSRVDRAADQVTTSKERLRANFALRLGSERGDEGSLREGEVRAAFNSPFWPFVLTTTSAGQEGLDFHTYCHAIVHWNLPANPVDLEQREGRVHRFMGHAVRRNIAARHGAEARTVDGDPWEVMWRLAENDREPDESEIRPWWVYPLADGRVIERYVPAMPLSRDRARAEQLRKAVGVYRLAFGQPHQDELLAYLGSEIDPELLARLADDLRIDLTPR